MQNRMVGSLMLLFATVIWGSALVSQSVAMNYLQPFSFQTIRCFLGFLIMLPIIYISDRANGKKNFLKGWQDKTLWKAGILCGIPLFFACNLQQFALVDTDAGKAGFLTAMYIVFVPIFGIFRKKKPSALVPVSVILAVAGLYLLSCVGVASIQAGDLFLIGCAVMFAVQINVIDHFVSRVDSLRFNAIEIFVCTILSAIMMAATETPTVTGIAQCLPQLAHAGFLTMGVAYALQILGQKRLEQAPAALIMSLESVFAAVFGALCLNEVMEPHELIGCGLLFAAVIISQIDIKPKKKSA